MLKENNISRLLIASLIILVILASSPNLLSGKFSIDFTTRGIFDFNNKKVEISPEIIKADEDVIFSFNNKDGYFNRIFIYDENNKLIYSFNACADTICKRNEFRVNFPGLKPGKYSVKIFFYGLEDYFEASFSIEELILCDSDNNGEISMAEMNNCITQLKRGKVLEEEAEAALDRWYRK